MAAKKLSRKNVGCAGRPGPGRPRGVPNQVTRDTREAFRLLVEDNADRLQGWLDRVGTKNPAKAAEILVKLAEFIVPRLARTEVIASPLIGADVSNLTSEQGYNILRDHPELPTAQQQRVLAHMRLLTQRPAIDPEPPTNDAESIAAPPQPQPPRAKPAAVAIRPVRPAATAASAAAPERPAAPPEVAPPAPPPPPTAAEVAAQRRAEHERLNALDAARRRDALRTRERRMAAEATAAAAQPPAPNAPGQGDQ
jgi:hypothetical protein